MNSVRWKRHRFHPKWIFSIWPLNFWHLTIGSLISLIKQFQVQLNPQTFNSFNFLSNWLSNYNSILKLQICVVLTQFSNIFYSFIFFLLFIFFLIVYILFLKFQKWGYDNVCGCIVSVRKKNQDKFHI